MNMDAVHETSSFNDQTMVPPTVDSWENIPVPPVTHEPAFSYDELFPSLPEFEIKPELPQVNMGQWTQKMRVKSSVITKLYHIPLAERKYRDGSRGNFGDQGGQAKICADIMLRTGAHLEVSSSKDQSLTILITGKEEAVHFACNLIPQELQTQVRDTISIPKAHHRFILGQKGKRLAELEKATSTKISVPRSDDNSDEIKIVGTKEGVEHARHDIQLISDKEDKKGFERLEIKKEYHPFIIGPSNEVLSEIMANTGARVNIPPPSVQKNELTISGEKEAVANAKSRILEIYDKAKNTQVVSIEVPKNQHRYIIGPRGQGIQEIFKETGVYVEIPPMEVQSGTINLRGEQANLGRALTAVYAKANSIKNESLTVPSWLHKYIIGKKGANIKNLSQDLTEVNIDFKDDIIKVEGPIEEFQIAMKKLKELIDEFNKQFSYAELKIKPEFHRHIIGKSGSNINRLKEATGNKATINIPSDESDIVRIEGTPEAVAQIKKQLIEMVQKMENEVTKELLVEHCYHSNMIGSKGEKIKEIKEEFNQVNITFPEKGLRSDKILIRGPKSDVDQCYRKLKKLSDDIKVANYSEEVPIYKQNHKFIIGKNGANIKKIREETNTRIDLPSEGAESNVITIYGRKEDVIIAKKKILDIQGELEHITTVDIMIPAKFHNSIIGKNGRLVRSITEDCGNVTIKFPPTGSGSDKVSIRGVKEDVVKAKNMLLDLSNEQQMTGYTAEVQADPANHKFLIGKNGTSIKKIREKTGARIIFPNENDEDRDIITIVGRKEEVEAAKAYLVEIIKNLSNQGQTEIEIDSKHHKHFVSRRAEVLKHIADEFGGVTVSFPKQGSTDKKVTLKGPHDYLEGVKQRLLEIVNDLEAMVTTQCIIAQEYHRSVLGARGSKVQRIQQDFNVSIKFPDRNKSDDAEKIMDDHSENEAESDQRNIIIIKGKPENCESARQALLELVPVTEKMEVPYDLHRFIIGSKGKDVREMISKFEVNIAIPPQSENSDIITIIGPSSNVELAKNALKEKIAQLELEKEDRALRSFQLTLEVDPQYHPMIIGHKGSVVNKLRKDHNVIITLPRTDTNDKVITITGYEKDAEAARNTILKLVEDQENMFKKEVTIDSRVHPRIIGSQGRNLKKINEKYNVQITFPRQSDSNPNLVIIQGDEDNVLEAEDHLLDLEDEYLLEDQERDYMRQHTIPSGRNGVCKWSGDAPNKGFVLKGAPWEKKNIVPDTSNTQEFPSFGGGPEPSKTTVVWGPGRR